MNAVMTDELLRQEIAKFRWYQPVSFGGGIVASNRAGPHTLASHEFGRAKWRYIVERNLPDVQGLRVLDLGCNCGLFSIELARAGAREVVGIDSERTWPGWKEQAQLVKEALEWRCATGYNVSFVEGSMASVPELGLGRFDVVMALCSIYYLGDDEIQRLLGHCRETGCPFVLLQGNTNRRDQSPEVRARATPRYLASALRTAGYAHTRIDAPLWYSRPVVVGSTGPFVAAPTSRRDRLRAWLRRRI
jgi:SAM-dependent methyltransferase